MFCCLCLLSFLIIAEIDNSLGILQNCKMTKVMKICDRYIVWLLVQLGAEAHFRDALIVEQILYFTLIWDLHCTLLLIIFTTKHSRRSRSNHWTKNAVECLSKQKVLLALQHSGKDCSLFGHFGLVEYSVLNIIISNKKDL